MDSFGKYELIERIGKGGMAEVFLAKSFGAQGVEKTLVIKRILPEFAQNDRFVEMFIAEAKIAMGLNHPNVVQIFDFGRVDQDYYLAMEHVDGVELSRLMKLSEVASKPLLVGDAIFLAMEVARGLDYAHRKKDSFGRDLQIVHRDISPQNLLVSRDGSVKIVDFGIAKASSTAEDGPNIVKGKYQYMSPEQALGATVDHRSDLFSLGVVLFEMITGRALFSGRTPEETMSRVEMAVVPDVQGINKNVPPQLEHVIYKALARLPEERYQSARDFQVDLTRVLYGLKEIHDSNTLSAHLRTLEEQLPPETLDIYIGGVDEEEGKTVRTRAARTINSGGTPQLGSTSSPSGSDLSVLRQRKEVVVLKALLESLQTEDGEGVKAVEIDELRTQALRIIDSIAFKYECTFVYDEENRDHFLILLGLPMSSERDAERATGIGLELQEAIAGLNGLEPPRLGIRMAIGLGEVVLTRNEAEPGPIEWVFHGNVQTRLERLIRGAKTGQLLVSELLYQRVRKNFRAQPLIVPEFGDAYWVKRPKSAREQIKELRQAFQSFYGREIEGRVLRNHFREALQSKRARGVMILGAVGVGKSTLMESFLGELSTKEVRVVRAIASPFDSDVPLASAVGFFSEMMKVDLSETPVLIREKIDQRIAMLFSDETKKEQRWLAAPIYELFDLDQQEGEKEASGGEEWQRRLFLSLSRLTNRLARLRPLVLAIDDAHFIDPVMRAFAAQYFDRSQKAPVFFVATAHEAGPHESSRSWKALLASRNIHVETIGELGRKEAEEMIRNRLRIHDAEEEELVELVLERSGGNPLYIKEVIRVLFDEGHLEVGGRSALIGEGQELLPSSVEGVISARLDRLEGQDREALQRVALLRSPFQRADAAVVLLEGPEEPLNRLVEAGYLSVQREKGEPQFRFVNALVQEVASRSLLPTEAKRLHGEIARVLIERGAQNDNGLIARHLDAAGESREAIRRYLDALEGTLERFGATECLRLTERVLRHKEATESDRFEALLWREKALREVGEKEEISETLSELETLAQTYGDSRQRAHVGLRKATYLFSEGNFKEARKEVAKTLEIAKKEGDKLFIARAWRIESMIALTEGERNRALSLIDRSIASLVMKAGPDFQEEMVRAYNMRGIILRQSGRHREALDAYETALAGAEAVNSPALVRQLLTNSGLALAFVGQFSEAKRRYLRSLDGSRRLGNRREEALVLVNLGHVDQMLGRLKEAQQYIRRGIYLANRAGDETTKVDGKITLGLTLMEAGAFKEAQKYLSTGLAKAETIPHAYLAVCALLGLAQLELLRDDPEPLAARCHAQEALRRCEDTGMIWGIAMANQLIAQTHLRKGEVELALNASLEAVALLEEVDIYGVDQVLLTHLEVLQEVPGSSKEEQVGFRRRIVEVFKERCEGIDEETDRVAFLSKPSSQKILILREMDELEG